MAKKLITVMQKGRMDAVPRIVKTRSDYITDMGKYGFWYFRKFYPVGGVSMAIEAKGKYRNFSLDGSDVEGLVMFFNGDGANPVADITDQQIALVQEWFATNNKEDIHGK